MVDGKRSRNEKIKVTYDSLRPVLNLFFISKSLMSSDSMLLVVQLKANPDYKRLKQVPHFIIITIIIAQEFVLT